MSEKTFNYKAETGQNPYCGIMSFQHFRGEKLYSDIVVKPENHMCETELVECYPISFGAEENGREQGFYPDSTIAYFRVLWKAFEPQQGIYNYKLIEDILNKAKDKSQTVIFRLLPHSTRKEDDVPEWLKSLIPCPERPDGKRVKDSPTDPLFIELFCNAIKKLGERFDDNPVFEAIDISVPGAWGEGYKLELYSKEAIYGIYDTYLQSFKHTQLISQIRNTEVLNYIRPKRDMGLRADGLGDPYHLDKLYPGCMEQISDFWKTAPVSFEAFWWMTEWKRQGWDIDRIIEKTLEWHITSFNPKSIPIPYEWEDKVNRWLQRMGYHYTIKSVSFKDTVKAGESLKLVLNIENVGVAPAYHKIPLYVKLKGEKEYIFETDVDIRKWMPGPYAESICIDVPDNIQKGKYDIQISIYDDLVKNVYFATDAEECGGWYSLTNILITD